MLDSEIIRMMIGVSAFVGILIFISVLWGVKDKQFDDSRKMIDGVLFDSEDDLNELINSEKDKKKDKNS
jgi:cbb3-type cytochrome oxidase maturation protein